MAIAAIALRNKRQSQPLPPLNAIELPNGKNAWKSSGDNKKTSRRRVAGRNKVGDAALLGQKDKSALVNNRQTGVVNIVLYVGFGLIAIGLILTFVGMGERGFKTTELKLIGPSLIGSGILFTLLRILFCSISSTSCKKKRPVMPIDEKLLLSPSQETLIESTLVTPSPNPAVSCKLIAMSHPSRLSPLSHMGAHADHLTPTASNQQQMIRNLLEDEVESDAELGLDVKYVQKTESVSQSRQNSAKNVLTQIENTESKVLLPNHEEVVLDPSKLSDLNNG